MHHPRPRNHHLDLSPILLPRRESENFRLGLPFDPASWTKEECRGVGISDRECTAGEEEADGLLWGGGKLGEGGGEGEGIGERDKALVGDGGGFDTEGPAEVLEYVGRDWGGCRYQMQASAPSSWVRTSGG